MRLRKHLLLLLSVVFTLSCAANEDKSRGYIVNVGDIAPDFTLNTTNGETVKLSSLRGKVVMLQFTASWCGVCRKEMPHIENDIWLRHKDNKDFALFGIDRQETLQKAQMLIDVTKITYPILMDTDSKVFTNYAHSSAGITRNILIGRDGKIIFLTRLFNEQEFKDLCEAIDRELKK